MSISSIACAFLATLDVRPVIDPSDKSKFCIALTRLPLLLRHDLRDEEPRLSLLLLLLNALHFHLLMILFYHHHVSTYASLIVVGRFFVVVFRRSIVAHHHLPLTLPFVGIFNTN